MNQIGQTNYEIGVMFKPLLSISMMRCRWLCDKSCYLKFADKNLVDKVEPLDSVID